MSKLWVWRDFYFNKKLTTFGFSIPVPRRENDKMTTIRESAKNYVPPVTENIADLEKVSTEIDIQTKTVHEGESDEFSYDYIVVEEKEYRVPASVLKQLKTQLEQKPETTEFKVIKEGEGLKTTYTVVLL